MNLLLIDDTNLFPKILSEAFDNSETKMSLCKKGAEGLDILKNRKIDLICVSMYLDDSDGISLTKEIRTLPTYSYTPVILFTSEESQHIYQEALSAGVTEVFQKKDVEQLTNFIKRFTLNQQPIDGHILYVEDSLSQQQMITMFFHEHGLRVDSFVTAEEAWSAFLKNDYDLVVTDIVLKGKMTGAVLTNRIRRLDNEKGDIPILALTGFDDVSRRIDLFYLGVSDYVAKPVVEEELLARVRNLISMKKYHSESLIQKENAKNANVAKSKFMSRMSHELRTPLNGILGFGELLEMNAADLDEKQKLYVHQIVVAGNHLLSLTNDLLDLGRIESGELKLSIEPVNIDEIVEYCVNFTAVQATNRGIDIVDSISGQGFVIEADSVRFKQVLLNLLSNAVKYNRENGNITLIGEKIGNNRLRIDVSDTGNGLSEDDTKRLFVPFDRLNADHTVEGTGIGLAISKQLTESMGGQMTVISELGKGSTFSTEFSLHKMA